ncbi:MAG TPA: hypothetical protein DCM62_01860 [Bacteroidales bacterium]|nr:hypothetical protein [Bacteroidales bacterium]
MQTINFLLIIVAVLLMASCNRQPASHGHGHGHGHTHDVIGGHTHGEDGHDHGDGMFSQTLFSEDYELFVEFPALVVGQISEFAAHITQLRDHKPLSEGSLTVSLIRDGRGIRHRVDSAATPGIFKPALQPTEAGTFLLLFELVSEGRTVSFRVPDIVVFADAHDAAHATVEQPHGETISFLKEQAWRSDFLTQVIQPMPFYSIIRTSGRVKSQPQAQLSVSAQVQGAVNLMVVLGENVNRGDLIAVISPTGIENNTSLLLNESKIAYERSRADYERSKPLASRQMLSQREFLEIQQRFLQDSLRFNQIARLVSQQGLRVVAPISGFVSSIPVANGQFVESGATIASVTNRAPVVIETFVNKSDFRRVGGIFDANFRIPGDGATINLREINGRVTSNNAFVNEQATRIPVVFSAQNNGELMPGMFLEAFLKTGKKEQALVVPLTAIVEEQGLHFVFIQTGGESFERRQVQIADSDGRLVEILSGLNPGDRVVSRGSQLVRLAAKAGALPLHGHTH